MKNFKSLIAVAAVAAVAVSMAPEAQAQAPVARTFSYSATPTFTAGVGNGSGPGNYQVSGTTTANVQPFFYATGAIGGTFEVAGYGAGVSSGTSQIDVYHNQVYTSTNTGYGDLVNQSDATQIIEHQMQETASRHDGVVIYPGPSIPASSFNVTGGPTYPAQTQGHLVDTFTHTITVGPEDGPGTYADAGTTTFNVQ